MATVTAPADVDTPSGTAAAPAPGSAWSDSEPADAAAADAGPASGGGTGKGGGASGPAAPVTYPLVVEYCPMCGLPPEYCRFNSKSVFAKCKPWLKEAHPQLVPEMFGEGELEAKLAAMAVDGGAATASANAAADAAVASSLSGPKLVKRAGGRSKRVDPEIVIHTDQRKGRKQVTIVVGLDLFDIKLSDAAKACKKAFASGATVAKSADNRDTVEIQGTRAHEFAELVRDKYKVPSELIFVVESKSKKRAFP
ncbi:hypothetical protein BU14_0025s0018 [Porphyra umbilicalis]|uniref:SUI1 domain-containing protein n=1 Tax=Porphyra umbilicalis TaxID=2786 RepID=A0A1X6PK60_PORUM|nr:hypothetical protein BU14_0025s0018 [Porphyra umbilicalis]|eukprot:OSX81136.1 hypothetical protein BU14_0025s0018 [Porphyra umbilicalis]